MTPSLRQEMGRIGRQGLEKYSWDNTVQNLVEIWEAQIAKKA